MTTCTPTSTNVHGLFGALIVEPAGAEFLDPETWEPLKSGTKAVIRTADGKMHREFVLALHDFALLFDGEGKPLNPPEHPGSDDTPASWASTTAASPCRSG